MNILLGGDLSVIFLSTYVREELITRAFDMGAVDYVVKPFSPTELAARRAALRRRAVSEPSVLYVLGDLTIDYAKRRVTLVGLPVELMAIEYWMLAELWGNAERVLTYEHLLQRVWGAKSSGDVRPTRTIVSKVRSALTARGENARTERVQFGGCPAILVTVTIPWLDIWKCLRELPEGKDVEGAVGNLFARGETPPYLRSGYR